MPPISAPKHAGGPDFRLFSPRSPGTGHWTSPSTNVRSVRSSPYSIGSDPARIARSRRSSLQAGAALDAGKSSIIVIIEDYLGQDPAMGSSQPPGPALVVAAADADPVALLVAAWLSAVRSENTRVGYARDIGITSPRRAGRAPS